MLSSLLDWRDQKLVSSVQRFDKLKERPNGVAVLILETRHPSKDNLEKAGLPQTDVVCEVQVINFRDVSGP